MNEKERLIEQRDEMLAEKYVLREEFDEYLKLLQKALERYHYILEEVAKLDIKIFDYYYYDEFLPNEEEEDDFDEEED